MQFAIACFGSKFDPKYLFSFGAEDPICYNMSLNKCAREMAVEWFKLGAKM